MNKLYDLAVVTSKFTTRDGKEKSRWENIGSLFERGDGTKFIMLKAHFNPAAISRKDGSDCIAVSLFHPKQRNETSISNEDSYSTRQDFYFNSDNEPDDLPF